jgi:hypothetical protein
MVESIQARGLVWISEEVLGGDQHALRAGIANLNH